MDEEFPPRRRYPRIASQHTVLVKRLEGQDLETFAHTRTMAVGGCCFVTNEAVGENSFLELLIAVEHRVISARAHVVYERHLENGRHEVGVEFAPLTAEDADAIQRIFEHPAQVE